jgi:exodeoxyribonuclease V
MVEQAARRDDRVVLAERVDADLMARSPVLVWRNATRIRLIHAFRAAFGAPEDELLPGEPLICDGIELPLKHRKKRIDLEARGLIKGAQVIYLGPGKRPGLCPPACGRGRGAAGLGRLDHQDREAGRGGALHPLGRHDGRGLPARGGGDDPQGARVAMGRGAGLCARPLCRRAGGAVEAGCPLWKRLAYVAITRAETRLHWVTRYRLARPKGELSVADLRKGPAALALEAGVILGDLLFFEANCFRRPGWIGCAQDQEAHDALRFRPVPLHPRQDL